MGCSFHLSKIVDQCFYTKCCVMIPSMAIISVPVKGALLEKACIQKRNILFGMVLSSQFSSELIKEQSNKITHHKPAFTSIIFYQISLQLHNGNILGQAF